MTPKVTGTRRVLIDHDCCTAVGVADAATKHRDRTEAIPLNMIADVEREGFQTPDFASFAPRHVPPVTPRVLLINAQPRATLLPAQIVH